MSSQKTATERLHSVVVGPSGSGKTSFLEGVEALNTGLWHLVEADEFYKNSPYLQDSLNIPDKPGIQLQNEMWFLQQRVAMISEILQKVQDMGILIDSGIQMGFAYAHKSFSKVESFTSDEWEAYEQAYWNHNQNGLRPDLVVYFQVPIETLIERIKERGRQFEIEYYDEEFLEGLIRGIEVCITELEAKEGVKVIRMDAKDANFKDIPSDVKHVLGLMSQALVTSAQEGV